jgi:hypothetical protein
MQNSTDNLAIVSQKPKPTKENMGLKLYATQAIRTAEVMTMEKCGHKPSHSEMIALMARAYIPYLKGLPPNYNIMTDITNRNLSLQ